MAIIKSFKWYLKASGTLLALMLLFLAFIEFLIRLFAVYISPLEANGVDYFSAYETFGRKLIWTRPTNSTISVNYQEFQYSFTTNSLGIRDIERDKENTQGGKRVLLLGDSFTESFGAADDSTIANMMQEMLDKKYSYCHLEVMNGAVAGSDLFFNYLFLKSKLIDYQPDIVLLNINSTDLMDYCVRGDLNRIAPTGEFVFRPCPINLELYKWSHIYRFWVHDVLGRDRNTFLTASEWSACESTFPKAANEVIAKLSELSVQQGFAYKVILQPLAFESAQQAYAPYFDIAKTTHTIDLLDSFAMVKNDATLYWPIDRHFTPHGYYLYTKFLVNRLDEEGLFSN
jgi:hypothetical protein